MRHPIVADQLFLWEEDASGIPILAIGFGNASMINHSTSPNATLERIDGKFQSAVLVACQEIKQDEEILLQYRLPLQTLI